MFNYKEKMRIHNANRVAIAAASAIAMFIDGIDVANVLYLGSAIAWLFLPECDAAEERILEKLKAGRDQIRAQAEQPGVAKLVRCLLDTAL